jgi:hypothetical protein
MEFLDSQTTGEKAVIAQQHAGQGLKATAIVSLHASCWL